MPEGTASMEDGNSDSPIVEAALAYQARGWRVIQLHGINSKTGVGCTCSKGVDCKTPGKHPVVDAWQKQPPMTADEIRAAWTGWRANHNLGIATGEESGFWVFDIDPDNGGMESAAKLAEMHPEAFDATRIVKTGSGGYHYYLAMPDFPVGNGRGRLKDFPGIDVRGTGGQVVAPPSVTDKGGYTVVADYDVAPAPAWLLDMIRPLEPTVPVMESRPAPQDVDGRLATYAQTAWNREVARLVAMREAAVPEGQTYVGEPWDATTFEVACKLLELANAEWTPYSQQDARNALMQHAPTDSGFNGGQVAAKFISALDKIGDKARKAPAPSVIDISDWDIPGENAKTAAEAAPTRDWPMRSWDDLGNSERMVDHYGDRLRYIPGVKTWVVYDGGRWAQVDGAVVQGLVARLFASRNGLLATTEALQYDDTPATNANGDPIPSDRERFLTFIGKQRMNSRITAVVNLTASQGRLHASLDDFDADPMLFNVSNGVIDLASGDLRPHDPDLLLMKQSPVTYDKTAACHGWQSFLDRVMPDESMQAYLQRIVGYCLSGSIAEQAFFIHHGVGANGKSVFLQVIRAVVGEYGQSVPRDALLSKKSSEHPTSVARMVGMRFLEVSETGVGKRLDEEMVKGLTGGEKQTARFMGKDFFDFTPSGKINYVTNHLPRLSDANSIWRRLHLIKWGVQIPHEEQDPHLAERLIRDELPGVLAWAVRGAQAWSQQRLQPPAAAGRDIGAYREDMDSFGEFLAAHTLPSADAVTKTNDLYLAYKGWAFGAGVKAPMSQQAFTAVMKERGYEYVRRQAGRFFKGVVVVNAGVASVPWDET